MNESFIVNILNETKHIITDKSPYMRYYQQTLEINILCFKKVICFWSKKSKSKLHRLTTVTNSAILEGYLSV